MGNVPVSERVRFAQIEPTTRCNYRCGFCVGRSMRQASLPWDEFDRFLAAHPALEHVELQGEGEPLLHPRFFDMVAACRQRGIRVSIITNGSMLGSEAVRRIVSAPLETVHISLESTDPTEFAAIRGGGFDKVINGIKRLMAERRAQRSARPSVGFCVTVLRRTMGAIHEIAELYRELGLDGGISVQQLQKQAAYRDHYGEDMLAELISSEQWQAYAWVISAVLARVQVRSDLVSFYGAMFAGFDPAKGECPWLRHGAFLTFEGAITGCCFMKDPSQAFGQLRQDPPAQIEARRLLLSEALARGAVPPACAGCGVANSIAAAQA